MNTETIQRIEQETCERYDERFAEYGVSPQTLGWDTKENQETRFEIVLDFIDWIDAPTLLDIGCGFADLYECLSYYWPIRYTGMDISSKLLAVAKERFTEARFIEGNILQGRYDYYDIAVMQGLLNYRVEKNYEYATEMIKAAFACCDTLIVDMLSSYLTPNYPREEQVFYYSPEGMFSFAQTLTSNVTLRHDYPPIPQKEFTLILRRE